MTSVWIQERSASGTLLIDMQTPMTVDTHTQSCLNTRSKKRVNILRLALSDDTASCRLCYLWIGWLGGGKQRRKLGNWIMPCQKNGAGNTQQHVSMYGTISH